MSIILSLLCSVNQCIIFRSFILFFQRDDTNAPFTVTPYAPHHCFYSIHDPLAMSTRPTSERTPRVVIKGPEPPSETRGGRAKKITDEDEDDAAVADPKGRIPRITWNLPRTDRLVKWLENNVEDCQKLFSDSVQDAKEGKRRRRTAKACIHVKMADYVFSVDEDVGIRDDVKVRGAKDYAKVVENRIAM